MSKANLNIDALVANMGTFVHECEPGELIKKCYKSIDMTLDKLGVYRIPDLQNRKMLPTMTTQSVIKPSSGCAFEPKEGVATMAARWIEACTWDLDLLLCPDEFYDTWLNQIDRQANNLHKEASDMPYYQAFMECLMAQIGDDMAEAFWLGVKGDTTLDPHLQVMDGLFCQINKAVDDAELVPHTIGEITPDNVIEKLELMADCLGRLAKNKPSKLIVTCEVERWFARAMKAGITIGYDERSGIPSGGKGYNPLCVRGTQTAICSDPCLKPNADGVHPMILTLENNIAFGYNRMEDLRNLMIERDKKQICILGKGRAGVQIRCLSTDADQIPFAVNEYFTGK